MNRFNMVFKLIFLWWLEFAFASLLLILLFGSVFLILMASAHCLARGLCWKDLSTFISNSTLLPSCFSSMCLIITDFSRTFSFNDSDSSMCSIPLVWAFLAVSPGYRSSHSLHFISYRISLVLQFPPFSVLPTKHLGSLHGSLLILDGTSHTRV